MSATFELKQIIPKSAGNDTQQIALVDPLVLGHNRSRLVWGATLPHGFGDHGESRR